jgi:hypothetical protein
MESPAAPDGLDERRRAPRSPLLLDATIREPGRSRTRVRVIDISTHGCRLDAVNGPSADSWVLLSIAGIETQYCRVVWQVHEFVGLEFANPITDLVLARLLEDQKLNAASVKELRSIAHRTHGLSARQVSEDAAPLAELSHKCAVDAVVEGLRLTDGEAGGRP